MTTKVVGSDTVPAMQAGDTRDFNLGPFDVLNLETGGYLADFTGSRVVADKPIAVFAGSEASDVPHVPNVSLRRCCADHLEHQLFPITSAGSSFVAARTPARTPAVAAAGGEVSIVDEPEYFRILATQDDTLVVTNLPEPDNHLTLHEGEHVTRTHLYGERTRPQIQRPKDLIRPTPRKNTLPISTGLWSPPGQPRGRPGDIQKECG